MNAALIRLTEEVRILTDNIRHLQAGGEAHLEPFEACDLIAVLRRERAEIKQAIKLLIIALPSQASKLRVAA